MSFWKKKKKDNVKLEIGQTVVYPPYGPATVIRVEDRIIKQKKYEFYVLRIVSNAMTAILPVHDIESSSKVRALITKDEIQKVKEILSTPNPNLDQTTWNRRYREYMEKIKTGSAYEIVEVLRNLYQLRKTKDLSFGERKMVDQCEMLLKTEISLVLNEDIEKIDLEEKEYL